jgi:hypothetical protein
VVVTAAEVLLPEADDLLGAQIGLVGEAIGMEQLAGPEAQGTAKPLADRHGETSLGRSMRFLDMY